MVNYKVGQVLYVILAKKNSVYPVQIMEEVTKKTLNGSDVSYVVCAGPNREKTLDLKNIDGEIFMNATEAEESLKQRSTGAIQKIIENAIVKATEWYPGSFESSNDDGDDDLEKIAKVPAKPRKRSNGKFVSENDSPPDLGLNGTTKVQLEDGSFATIKLPDSLKG